MAAAYIWSLIFVSDWVSGVSSGSGALWSADWSETGNRVATGGDDGNLYIWQAYGGDLVEIGRLAGHSGSILSVSWSPDGTRLISGGSDGSVRIWDASGDIPSRWSQLALLENHTFSVRVTVWSPCGDRVLSGGDGFRIRAWEVSNESIWRRVFIGFAGVVKAAAWSPDCSRAVTAGLKALHLWQPANSLESWEPQVVETDDGWLQAAAWSPRSSLIAAGGDSGILYVWQAPGALRGDASASEPAFLQWRELRQFRLPSSDSITSAAWSPYDYQVAVGSRHGFVFVWDLLPVVNNATGLGSTVGSVEETINPQVLRGAGGAISAVTWSSDGSILLVTSYGGMALWCSGPGEEVWQSCAPRMKSPSVWSLPMDGPVVVAVRDSMMLLGFVALVGFSLLQAGDVWRHLQEKDVDASAVHRRTAFTCAIVLAWISFFLGLCSASPGFYSGCTNTFAAVGQTVKTWIAGLRDIRGAIATILGVEIPVGKPGWLTALLSFVLVLALLFTLAAIRLLWSLFRAVSSAVRRRSHPGACVAVCLAIVAAVVGLLVLVWWIFAQIFGHTVPRFTVAPMIAPTVWFVVHIASFFTTVGRTLVSLILWLRTVVLNVWQVIVNILHCHKLYMMIVPSDWVEKGAHSITDSYLSKPMLEKEGLPIPPPDAPPKVWAAALIEVMHTRDTCSFEVKEDHDIYSDLEDALDEDGLASIPDLLRFPVMYIKSLLSCLRRCFYRQLWLDDMLRDLRVRQKALVKERAKLLKSGNKQEAEDAWNQYMVWQLVEDQLSWYCHHALVLADVLALLTARDASMYRVVRLWKALDDAICAVLPRVLFPRLWSPTPLARRKGLLARRSNVGRLAAEWELSPDKHGRPVMPARRDYTAEEELQQKCKRCNSLSQILSKVQSLTAGAREAGGVSSYSGNLPGTGHVTTVGFCPPESP